MKKAILITIAICFTTFLTKAQNNFTHSGLVVKTPYHMIIGDNLNRKLWVRHIKGKAGTSNALDHLYLNYNTGKAVYIGYGGQNSNLNLSGKMRFGQTGSLTSAATWGGYGTLGNNWIWINGKRTRLVDAPSSALAFTPTGSFVFASSSQTGPAYSEITSTRNNMWIYNTGGVKILPTPDRYELEVDGTGRFKEVLVEEGWSDYVFDDDYALPTIDEQMGSIKEKGHLANFQSEEEMGGEINIGDVTKRQQQTIEELMLYIGQLNNRIEALETKLSE